jgi:SAM-dependent methyltransferase
VDDPADPTRASYEAIAARFLEKARHRTEVVPHLARFAEALPRHARVLDVGSGPGIHTAALRNHGLRAIGVDYSRGMLRSGLVEFPGPRVLGDARRLPMASRSFGGVWANASLVHLPPADAMAALREIHRVLAHDGLLHLALKEGAGAAAETGRYDVPRIFRYWSAGDLDAALDAAGFTVLDGSVERAERTDWLVRLARRVD